MLTELSSCRHVPALIEPEPFDDENGDGYDTLDRWGDMLHRPWNDRFTNELLHAAD